VLPWTHYQCSIDSCGTFNTKQVAMALQISPYALNGVGKEKIINTHSSNFIEEYVLCNQSSKSFFEKRVKLLWVFFNRLQNFAGITSSHWTLKPKIPIFQSKIHGFLHFSMFRLDLLCDCSVSYGWKSSSHKSRLIAFCKRAMTKHRVNQHLDWNYGYTFHNVNDGQIQISLSLP